MTGMSFGMCLSWEENPGICGSRCPFKAIVKLFDMCLIKQSNTGSLIEETILNEGIHLFLVLQRLSN